MTGSASSRGATYGSDDATHSVVLNRMSPSAYLRGAGGVDVDGVEELPVQHLDPRDVAAASRRHLQPVPGGHLPVERRCGAQSRRLPGRLARARAAGNGVTTDHGAIRYRRRRDALVELAW